MEHAVVADVRRRHAVAPQAGGERFAFVAQRVELGGDHVRGRKTREARGAQRRGVGIRAVLRAGEIVVPEPAHHLAREQIALLVLLVGSRREVVVRDGIDQQLVAQRRAAAIARHQRHHGREVAARAVAADRDARGVDADLGALLGHPARGRVAILGPGRKLVLGSQPVVDRHHDATDRVREAAAGAVVRVEARRSRSRRRGSRRAPGSPRAWLGA